MKRLSTAVLARWALGLGLAALGFTASAGGEPPGAPSASKAQAGSDWQAMSPRQRTALAPLQRDWASLTSEQKQKWLEVAARFDSLSLVDRERIQGRMSEWAKLSPSERGRARLGFQEARQITPEDRQARWEAYQSMPPEQRQKLAERAAAASAPVGPARQPAPTAATEKRNTVQPQRAQAPRPVTSTTVQAGPGATTTLMSQPAEPPAHHQPGLPKIAATEGFVDPATLLPRRGPQGAGRLDPASSSGDPEQP